MTDIKNNIDSPARNASHSDAGGKTEELFKSGAHFGYSVSKSHPKMKQFIFASRNGVSVFDLDKTRAKLDEAREFVKKIGKEKKSLLFVGTKKEAKLAVENCAVELGMPFVAERWLGGSLTNYNEIKKRLDFLKNTIAKKLAGGFDKNTKKERLVIDEKVTKMKVYFDGIEKLTGLPGAMIVIDPKEEAIAVAEAKKQKVPVVALMNSDCDVKSANYPVPANDASVSTIQYFLKELGEAYKEGVSESAKEVGAIKG